MVRLLALLLIAGLILPVPARAWGFRAHRWINEEAISTLPSGLREHFARNRERLSDLAIEPDTVLRKRDGKREAVRHFIDLDLYGRPPFDELPRSRRAATRKFGRQSVNARGTLPWRILDLHARLRRQMERGEWSDALRTAGLAGHYVGDAFMPLHTTDNHDGQRTGNRGIHRNVERELVDARLERFREQARLRVGRAPEVEFSTEGVFAILIASHLRVDELVRADVAARRAGPPPGPAYLDALEAAAGALLVEQLAGAVSALGAFWASAWKAAGRPPPPRSRGHSQLDSPGGRAYDPAAEWRMVEGAFAVASP